MTSFNTPRPYDRSWWWQVCIATSLLPLLLACTSPPPKDSPASQNWVEQTLQELSLREQAAQLIFVRAHGLYHHPDSAEYQDLLHLVTELKVGGLVLFRSELETVPRLLNGFQRRAEVPLLVAADLERGLDFRVLHGAVPLPFAMAIGATRSTEAARFAGAVTARGGRALGIHWALAPVVDVNIDPQNPVIGLRSFGEDPKSVARLASAFIRGARQGGILTTAKHFPGHGDTATDSHEERPVLAVDRERLESVEWPPFRAAVTAGVDAIMVGHVAVPALDPSGAPATLSRALSGEILRGAMGFEGLIVTDALEMKALRPAWTGEAAVGALQAGADVLLLPRDAEVAVRSIVRAVRAGRVPRARFEESVRRVLGAKARLGLDRNRLVQPEALLRNVGRPRDLQGAREIAQRAITLVRNRGEVVPLHAEEPLRLFHVVLWSDPRSRGPGDLVTDELEARRIPVETVNFGPEITAATRQEVVKKAQEATHILVSAFVRTSPDPEQPDLSPSQLRLLETLLGSDTPMLLTSFGSPYLLTEVPEVPIYLCAFGPVAPNQRAAVEAVLGEIAVTGKLPVTLPGLYRRGHGIQMERTEMTLQRVAPEEAGFRPGAMNEVDAVIERFVAQGAFPGAVVAVGHQRSLVHLQGYGHLSYDAIAAPVTPETLYDLASLTKIVATTTMAMILVDQGKLVLEKPVVDYLPGFVGPDKEEVTVWHLLTHSSGMDWWAPLYKELEGQEAFVERILAMDLVYEPGTQSMYSDLGIILLGEILERVAGEPLAEFVEERIFTPLGMDDTMFTPPKKLWPEIAPTERDSWRGRVLQGEVHDENAYAMGGIAPHAGLFSTAGDLARFAQMILNGGVFEHHRIVSRATLERFTRRAGVPDSTRAIGWDTKSAESSSAGTLFSPNSFGHTGFTGTSLWIDPERELFVILLTNRVHPTRDNELIREARPALADAVVQGLSSQ